MDEDVEEEEDDWKEREGDFTYSENPKLSTSIERSVTNPVVSLIATITYFSNIPS